MEERLEKLILSYMKQRKTDYSYQEMSDLLGITVDRLRDLIHHLLFMEYLDFERDYLQLTNKGRLYINSSVEDLLDFDEKYSDHTDQINPNIAMSLDLPYVPEHFLDKIKKG